MKKFTLTHANLTSANEAKPPGKINILRITKFLILFFLFVFGSKSSNATKYTASVTGNWNSTATWGNTASTPGALVATDTVKINSGVTVTLTVTPNYAISVDTINSTGVLLLSSNASLSVTNVLAGTGTLTMGANSTLNIGGAVATTLTLNCTTNTPNTVVYNSTNSIANQIIKGNMTYYNLTITSGNNNFPTTVGTGAITCNGNLTISGGYALSDGGFMITGTPTDTFFMQSFATYTTLQTALPFYPVNFGTDSLTGYYTINFYGNGSFTLPDPPYGQLGFNYLGIGGTGTKTSVANPLFPSYLVYAPGGGVLALNYGLFVGSGSITGNSNAVLDIEDGGGALAYTVPSISGGLGRLIVNRAAGVTLGAPLTLSAGAILDTALEFNNGLLNTTSTNLLTITTPYPNAISGGSAASFVNGPMVETLEQNESGALTHTFPLGDATIPSYNPLQIIGAITSSGTAATIQAQLFTGPTGGSPGALVTSINSNHYWSTSVVANAASITTMGKIALTDLSVTTGNVVCYSATKTGTYNALASTISADTVKTTSAGPSALGYFVIGTLNPAYDFNGATVGTGGTFPSLTNAGGLFAAINAVGFLQHNSQVTIISNLNAATESGTGETGTYSLNAFSGGYTLTIKPGSAVNDTISGTGVTTDSAMISINGASNVIIDGSFGGSGQHLLFRNTNTTAANAGPTIQFNNVASNCTLKNCFIESNDSATTRGVVMIGSHGANTGITLSGNNIYGSTGDKIGNPVNGIYSNNSANQFTISGNNIYNFLNNGIYIQGAASGSKITGNSIYQTTSFTSSAAMTGMYLNFSSNPSSNDTIQGNFIGGNASALPGSAISGTWTCSSSSSTFYGIECLTQQALTVVGNTIGGISFTTKYNTTPAVYTAPGIFCGIYAPAANPVNIGLAGNGNTIGSSAAPITVIDSVTSGLPSPYMAGIYTSGTSYSVLNNTVSAITFKSVNTGCGFIFNGIDCAGSAGTYVASNNTIGGSGASAITIGTSATSATTCTVNGILMENSTTANITAQGNTIQNITANNTGVITFNGISATANSGSLTIGGTPTGTLGNTISTLNAASTSSTTVIRGINVTGSTTSALLIQGNTISSLQSNSTNTHTGGGAAIIGILDSIPEPNESIDQNTISGLNATYAATNTITVSGITLGASTASSGTCTRNKIYGFTTASTTGDIIIGINTVYASSSAGWTVANNMITQTNPVTVTIYGIRDEIVASGSVANYDFNSVYIGGVATSSNSITYCFYRTASGNATESIKNNIFINERTGSGANSYCIANGQTSITGFTGWTASSSNYNILGSDSSSSNQATIGYWNGQQKTFPQWLGIRPGGSTGDSSSLSGSSTSPMIPPADSIFVNKFTGDLHLLTNDMAILHQGTPLAASGSVPLGIDIDGQSRSATNPDIGADETCSGFVIPSVTITVNQPNDTICSGTSVIFTANPVNGGLTPSYQWKVNGVNAGTNSATYTNSSLANNNVVSVTMTSSACASPSTASYSVTMTVKALPSPSFTAQAGANTCTDTTVTYKTQSGQTNYAWGFTGTLNTDYSIISGGTLNDSTVTIKWLTAGSKTVTVNYTNSNGCPASSPTSSNATTVAPCGFTYTVHLFLQGYYNSATHSMSPLLYLLYPNTPGRSSTDVDSVKIVLRSASSGHARVDSSTAVLQTNGNLTCAFKISTSGGNYYIDVKHRNSLEIWSASTPMFSDGGSYDLTAVGGGYGAGSTVLIDNNTYGIYSGDINQDGFVNSNDRLLLKNALHSFNSGIYPAHPGDYSYKNYDLTGDAILDKDDLSILQNNISSNGGVGRAVITPP